MKKILFILALFPQFVIASEFSVDSIPSESLFKPESVTEVADEEYKNYFERVIEFFWRPSQDNNIEAI